MKDNTLDIIHNTSRQPKLSVIIPLYNKAPYVRKALESVLAQTYTNFELIVVDDGSTDESANIAETMLREIKGYRLEVKGQDDSIAETNAYNLSPINYKLIRQANAGVAAARNNGVAQANGDYLAFLDADDWWEPTYLERMVQLIADYPDAGLYASNYYYHKDGQNIVKVDIPTGYFDYPKEYYRNFAMPVWTGATIIPKPIYGEMNGFPLGIKLGEDFLLWAKIAMQYKVAFLNEPLAYYNNTLPPNYRATYKLHKSEEHMLFRLDVLGDKAIDLSQDWRRLIDMLRIHGLYAYWLSDEYHELVQRELNKVDWSNQHDFLVKMYRYPRWVLKVKQKILQIASTMKRKFIK